MRRAALFVALALAAVAACGVPDEGDPRELASDDVPFDLLDPGSTTTSSTIPRGQAATVTIYLVGTERLAPVTRELRRPVELEDVFTVLLEGAAADEEERGLSTAIPEGTDLRRLKLTKGVLTLDLSEDINEVGADLQQRAIAQLVFTATQFPKVTGVRFRVEGKAAPVPISDGSLQSRPISRRDYRPLNPNRA